MSGPSDKAWAVAHNRRGRAPETPTRDLLLAAHDPALGMDRSVCLRDVIEKLRSTREWQRPDDQHLLDEVANFIEREFGSDHE